MPSKRIDLAIFTESSKKIGTGHLMESLHLAKLARKSGMHVSFWVNRDAPKPVLKRIPFSYQTFTSLEKAKEAIHARGYTAAVFNFRKIDNRILRSLRGGSLKTLCVDEAGHRRLDCDAIINPVIVKKYHFYPSIAEDRRIYTGADYLSLSPKFKAAHRKKRDFRGRIKEIAVCMGGVDRTGATLHLVDVLAQWRREARKDLIIGGGFPFLPELKKRVSLWKGSKFKIYYNVNNVIPILERSDVVFTAGGNTLYELACLGIPAICLYEDPHERGNGWAFKERGFGMCLGKGRSTPGSKIFSALKEFDDPLLRTRHSLAGRKIVDAKGAERIMYIIKGLIKND